MCASLPSRLPYFPITTPPLYSNLHQHCHGQTALSLFETLCQTRPANFVPHSTGELPISHLADGSRSSPPTLKLGQTNWPILPATLVRTRVNADCYPDTGEGPTLTPNKTLPLASMALRRWPRLPRLASVSLPALAAEATTSTTMVLTTGHTVRTTQSRSGTTEPAHDRLTTTR